MPFKEYFDSDGSCENCPIRAAGLCSWGNSRALVDPRCADESIPDDMDIDEWIEQQESDLAYWDWREDKELEQRRKKQVAAQKSAETRRQMRAYCFSEIFLVRKLKKVIKQTEKYKSRAQCLVAAFNITNEMFGYDSQRQVDPEIDATLEVLNEQLKTAEENLKLKRKEFYARRKKEKESKA